jgi:hypothetical protein
MVLRAAWKSIGMGFQLAGKRTGEFTPGPVRGEGRMPFGGVAARVPKVTETNDRKSRSSRAWNAALAWRSDSRWRSLPLSPSGERDGEREAPEISKPRPGGAFSWAM